ncbi:MAG: prepilin-type N-terminal cleavage/methylation domain-containing protein [Gammaproteobacteria bacterium]|nr:MAG: prepilin-type N-terminal cleavage/methylation domain-containing protein [Gammaproteobacteria bacterium]
MSSPRGTTLVELLTVLAILALLAGIAWPGYLHWRARQWRLQAIEALLDVQLQELRAHRREGRYVPVAALHPPALPRGARLHLRLLAPDDYRALVELPLPAGTPCRRYVLGPRGPVHGAGAAGPSCWVHP